MAEPSVTPGCLVKSAIAVVLLLAAVEGSRAVVHKTIQVYALKDTPRPKIFAPLDFYILHLTIRVVEKICENLKTIMIYLKYM
jgi:hypothetical protein